MRTNHPAGRAEQARRRSIATGMRTIAKRAKRRRQRGHGGLLPDLTTLPFEALARVTSPHLLAALKRIREANTGKPHDALAGFNSAF